MFFIVDELHLPVQHFQKTAAIGTLVQMFPNGFHPFVAQLAVEVEDQVVMNIAAFHICLF
jgi:hypothetical protein